MAKRTVQHPIVSLRKDGLFPVSRYDMDLLGNSKIGDEFDLVPRKKRSLPQHRLYWQALTIAVNATGDWPTPEHCHDELKLACGYVRKILDWNTGQMREILDSTGFDAMTQDQFQTYFNMAMAKLSAVIGFDPLAELEAA